MASAKDFKVVRGNLTIFLCHASEDKPAVRKLYDQLRQDGFLAWLDEEDLMAGQEWQLEIPRAVRNSHVVIVCLSRAFHKKGYRQKEVRLALDVADEQPEGTIFLIPLKFENCEVPARLARWQWASLFDGRGYEKLVRALDHCATTLSSDSLNELQSASVPVPQVVPVTESRSRKSYALAPVYWLDQIRISADGQRVGWVRGDGGVAVFDLSTKSVILDSQCLAMADNSLACMAFSPDGHFLAVASDSAPEIFLHDLEHQTIESLRGPEGGCGSLAFSHDGKHLVAGFYDLTVHIFDLAIGKSVKVVKAGHKSGYYELSTSPRASIFAATVKDKYIGVFEIPTGRLVKRFASAAINTCFSNSGNRLFAFSKRITAFSQHFELWDVASGKRIPVRPPVFRTHDGDDPELSTHSEVWHMKVHSDENRYAIGYHGGVGIGSLSTGEVVLLETDLSEVFQVSISSNGILAYAGANPPLKLWNVDAQFCIAELGSVPNVQFAKLVPVSTTITDKSGRPLTFGTRTGGRAKD